MNGAGVGGYFMGGAGASFKSVQRSTILVHTTASATATISAVDTTQARLRKLGQNADVVDTGAKTSTILTKTNSTTITAAVTTGSGDNITTSFEIEEYNTGYVQSIQSGTITAAAGTATVTAVTTTRSLLDHLGQSDASATFRSDAQTYLVLTNSTTITMTFTSNQTQVGGYQLTQFNQ